MMDYPHVQAAFINAIRAEGTKEEACDWLQKQWNETCALRRGNEVSYLAGFARCKELAARPCSTGGSHMTRDETTKSPPETTKSPPKPRTRYTKICPSCYVNRISVDENECPGCEAYRDHQA